MARQGLLRDERAVTEVVGFVLSFALSAIFLLIALNIFYTAQGSTDAMLTGVELKAIADRVAARVVEAGLVGQEFPDAKMVLALDVPQTINGVSYTIRIDNDAVRVTSDDGTATATATTFRLDAVSGIVVGGVVDGVDLGKAYSSNERIVIVYEQTDLVRRISIQEA